MILIPEQISLLREAIRREKEVTEKYEKYLKTVELVDTNDFLRKKNLLLKNDFLRGREVNKIALGTKFTMKLYGEEEVEAILVDEELDLLGVEEKYHFISRHSPLGQLLLGRQAGSFITKTLENGNSTIIGTVEDIKTESKDYVNFIRDRKRDHRQSKVVRRYMKNLEETREEDPHAQQEWEERRTITESQRQLLKEKASRLMNGQLTSNEKYQLFFVRKLLAEREVATLPEDGTIGIGSEFSITLATKDKMITKRVELINEAFCDETDDEYIERMDPLGNQIFGLKEGDSFYYQSAELGPVNGIVFDIDNSKRYPKTNSAIVYHTKNVKKGGLVRSQVEMLETELEYRRKILEVRKETRKKEGYDFMSSSEIDELKMRITEIGRLLTEKKIIENPNSDTIDIGSSFYLSLDYGDDDIEEMEATLVEKFVSHEASSDHFISMETEMGQAIYGKKEGESFSYLLPTGATITGEVLEIAKTDMVEKAPLQKRQ